MSRKVFAGIGIALLLVSIILLFSSSDRDRRPFDQPRVPLVGNQFEGAVADVVGPFEQLVKQANERVIALQNSAAKYNSASSIGGWAAIFITSSITILAALAGVSATPPPPGPGDTRSKVVVAIAVLAAVSSSLLLVNQRLEKSSDDARKTANQLYEQTSAARLSFVNASSAAEAQRARDGLFHALADSGASVAL